MIAFAVAARYPQLVDLVPRNEKPRRRAAEAASDGVSRSAGYLKAGNFFLGRQSSVLASHS
jgi:hypothetical protein